MPIEKYVCILKYLAIMNTFHNEVYVKTKEVI